MIKRVDKSSEAQAEKEAQREKKWANRGKKFWSSFLFTKDGKPKSSLLIYTFCLSFVFVGLLLMAFWFLTDAQNAYLSGLSPLLSNIITTLAISVCVILIGWIMHHFMKDKRLIFGTFIWLALYCVATVIGEAIMLASEEGGFGIFMTFFVWVAIIPVLAGLVVFYFLYRRDYQPPVEEEKNPVGEVMKKYVDRR